VTRGKVADHLWQRPEFTGAEGRDGFNAYYDSWKEFMSESTAAKGDHFELNILYGWNWHKPGYAYGDDAPYDGPELLETFWILPRRNAVMVLETEVTPADEPAVRTWLEDMGASLVDTWRPVVVLPRPAPVPPGGDSV
jgi:hypothetical protein